VERVKHANQVGLGGPSGRGALQDEIVLLMHLKPNCFVLNEVRAPLGLLT
jgi:hypothetical protein